MLSCETPRTAACQASLSITISWSLLKFMSIDSVTLSNYLTLCCSLLLLPSIFPSTRVFSSELALRTRWLKYRASTSASALPMNIQGPISYRIDWFDLLAVQGTLKSSPAPQFESSVYVIVFLSRSKHLLTSFNIMLFHQCRFNIP